MATEPKKKKKEITFGVVGMVVRAQVYCAQSEGFESPRFWILSFRASIIKLIPGVML